MRMEFAIRVVMLCGLTLPATQAADVLLIGPSPNPIFSDGGLAQYGHHVTIGPNYDVFDGSFDLSAYDVVILSAAFYQLPIMSDAGQTQLFDFVAAGGGLITGEWTVWRNDFEKLKPLFPTTTDQSYIGGTQGPVIVRYQQVTADPFLNAGIPSSFDIDVTFVGGLIMQAKPGATTFYSGNAISDPANEPNLASSAGVVGWNYGSGRVMNFSTTLQQPVGPGYTDDYSRLLANSITWASQPVPEPSTFILTGVAATAFIVVSRCRRTGASA